MDAPRIVRPNRGQRRAIAHTDHRITLPRWARLPWMVLHELAHRLCHKDVAHGERFVGVLIGLLARHDGRDPAALMAAADAAGVRYRKRSIGAVPEAAIPMRERLLQSLPASPVEAAIELGLHWRQVNGHAIRLVQEGRARWRGGRLLPGARAGCKPPLVEAASE